MALDTRFQQISGVQSELRDMLEELRDNTLGGAGGGGSHGDARLDRLEQRYDKLSDDVSDIKSNLAQLSENVRHLPTKESQVKIVVSALALIAAMITFAEKLQSLIN